MTQNYYILINSYGTMIASAFVDDLNIACQTFKLFNPTMSLQQIEEFVIHSNELTDFFAWRKEFNLALSQEEMV